MKKANPYKEYIDVICHSLIHHPDEWELGICHAINRIRNIDIWIGSGKGYLSINEQGVKFWYKTQLWDALDVLKKNKFLKPERKRQLK